MKKILLANIGNRNITIKDKTGDYLEVVPFINKNHLNKYVILNERGLKEEFHFRNFTKDLLEEWKLDLKTNHDFRLQILTESELQMSNYEEVVLFYTDQSPSRFDYQDTLFETELIINLLSQMFPLVKFTAELVKGNPTDFNNLYQQYAQIIKSLLSNKSDFAYSLLDAGGTTQMKMAAKAVFEYYAKQNHKTLEIRYVDHWSENSYEVDRTLQSKYLLLDLASDYLRSFDLDACVQTMERLVPTHEELGILYEQIKVLNTRLKFEPRPLVIDFQQKINNPTSSIEKYIKSQLEPNTIPFLTNLANRKNVFEIASICQFYFIGEQYTLGVATFYRLSEEICQCFVEEKTNLDLSKAYNRETFINRFAVGLGNYLPNNSDIKYGLPALLAFCHKSSKDTYAHKIFDTLLKTCSIVNRKKTGMNTLRNHCWLAHENQAIKKQDIEDEVSGFLKANGVFATLMKNLGMPNENVFFTSQKELLTLFSQL